MNRTRKLSDAQEREVALAYLCGVDHHVIAGRYDVSWQTIRKSIVGERSYLWQDPVVEAYRTRYGRDTGRNAVDMYLFAGVAGSTPATAEQREQHSNVFAIVSEALFKPGIEAILQKTALREYTGETKKAAQSHPYDRFIQDVFGKYEKERAYGIVESALHTHLASAYQRSERIDIPSVFDAVSEEIIDSVRNGGLAWSQVKKNLVHRILCSATQDPVRVVLGMRYGLDQYDGPETLGSIAETLRLSKERIRQIQGRGLWYVNTFRTSEDVHPLDLLRRFATDATVKQHTDKMDDDEERKKWVTRLTPEIRDSLYTDVLAIARANLKGEYGILVPPSLEQIDNPLYLKSVDELELSVRSANCLSNAGIETIGELCKKTEPDLLKIKNFGRKSLKEIKKLLEKMGLQLKGQ